MILSSIMIELRVYTEPDGKQPFIKWLESIDRQTRTRVNIALLKLEEGNIGNLKSVGDGVHEIRLTFGAGVRIYLGYEGHELVILLYGGTKRRQSADISKAKAIWQKYLTEKRTERS